MVDAQARLDQWLTAGPCRYYVITGHPGHGVPSVRIRLHQTEVIAEQLNLDMVKITGTVTEDGQAAELAVIVNRALDRWEKGEFDQRPVALTPVTKKEES